MAELDRQYRSTPNSPSPEATPGSSPPTEFFGALAPVSETESNWPPDLLPLHSTLSSLISQEDALASELSGGIKVSRGRSGVYVRAGWQALITPNRAWPLTDIRDSADRPTTVTNQVAGSLLASQRLVAEFWSHPMVRRIVSTTRVRLEESAAL